MRRTNIKKPGRMELRLPTQAEKRPYKQAKGDPCELVRICAERGVTLYYATLADEPQFRRLAFLRIGSPADIGSFFK